MSVTEATEDIRSMAAHLVDVHRHRSGGRMQAYDDVARLASVSSAWLRKFIGRRPDAALSFAAAFNIHTQYHKICDLIDARADAERDRADAIGKRLNENFRVFGSMVPRVAPTTAQSATDEEAPPRGDSAV